MADLPGCLACDLSAGRRALPGGLIYETSCWRVEHCVSPLGVGTLLVKPKRHVVRVSELTNEEADEQGPLVRRCALVVDQLLAPEQTYVCLWSHADGVPVHIHYVVQPISREAMDRTKAHGPKLQVAMLTDAIAPPIDGVTAFCDEARHAFRSAP